MRNSSGLIDLITETGAIVTTEDVVQLTNATSAIPTSVIDDLIDLAEEIEAAEVLAEVLGLNATDLIDSGIVDELLNGSATSLVDLMEDNNITLTAEDVAVIANSTSIPPSVIAELEDLIPTTPPPPGTIEVITEAVAELLGVDPSTIDPDVVTDVINGDPTGLVDLIDSLGTTITLEDVEAFANTTDTIPVPVIDELTWVAEEMEIEDEIEATFGLPAGTLGDTTVAGDILNGDSGTLLDLLDAEGIEVSAEDVQELEMDTDLIPGPVLDDLQTEAEQNEIEDTLTTELGLDPTVAEEVSADVQNGDATSLIDQLNEAGINILPEDVAALTSATDLIPDSALDELQTEGEQNEIENALTEFLGVDPTAADQVSASVQSGDATPLIGQLDVAGSHILPEAVADLETSTDLIPDSVLEELQTEAEQNEIEDALTETLELDPDTSETVAEDLQNGDSSALIEALEETGWPILPVDVELLLETTTFIPDQVQQELKTEAEQNEIEEAITESLGLNPTIADEVAEAVQNGDPTALLDALSEEGINITPEEVAALTNSTELIPEAVVSALQTEASQNEIEGALSDVLEIDPKTAEQIAEAIQTNDSSAVVDLLQEKGIDILPGDLDQLNEATQLIPGAVQEELQTEAEQNEIEEALSECSWTE